MQPGNERMLDKKITNNKFIPTELCFRSRRITGISVCHGNSKAAIEPNRY